MNKLLYLLAFCMVTSLSFAEEKHQVNKGDTLWDLAGQYYNDSFSWPTIWKYNTFINNPDLIYPKEMLIIPGYTKGGDRLSNKSDVFKLGTGTNNTAEMGTVETKDVNDTAHYTVEKKDNVKIIRTANGLELIPYAFNFERSYPYETLLNQVPKMQVIATEEGKSFVSTGDVLRINTDTDQHMAPGDRVIIFSLDMKIPAGYVLEVAGIGEIKKIDTDNALVMLTDSYDSISKGYYAAPFDTLQKKNPVGFMDVQSNIKGKIVYLHDNAVLSGKGYNCILDIGSTEGIKPGDILHVIRTVNDDDITRTVKLAEVQAIYVNDISTTALIIQSDSEIKKNDAVILRKIAVN